MRASLLSGIGLACVLNLAGCGQGTNPVEPGSLAGAARTDAAASNSGGGAQNTASASANGGPSAVNKGLAEIRQATAAFHDVSAAIAAGYADPATGVCDSSPAGIMGIHSPNGALIADGEVDPLKPEVLQVPAHGGWELPPD